MRHVGHDVEMFVFDGTTGKVVPGHVVVDSIENKLVWNKNYSFEIKTDNVMVEINPVPTPVPVFSSFNFAQKEILYDKLIHNGWYIDDSFVRNCHYLLDSPAFWEFNCRPSYSIWTGEKVIADVEALGTYRLAGGHIHFESNNLEEIKLMDLFLGLQEVIDYSDTLELRKKVGYGVPGNFRKRFNTNKKSSKYILEYRTISNRWWAHSFSEISNLTYLLRALDIPVLEKFLLSFVNSIGKELQDTIINNDIVKALLIKDMFAEAAHEQLKLPKNYFKNPSMSGLLAMLVNELPSFKENPR